MQVVGRAEPHNLALIHPEQNRVLTIRENARTQVGSHRILRVQTYGYLACAHPSVGPISCSISETSHVLVISETSPCGQIMA